MIKGDKINFIAKSCLRKEESENRLLLLLPNKVLFLNACKMTTFSGDRNSIRDHAAGLHHPAGRGWPVLLLPVEVGFDHAAFRPTHPVLHVLRDEGLSRAGQFRKRSLRRFCQGSKPLEGLQFRFNVERNGNIEMLKGVASLSNGLLCIKGKIGG